MLWISGGCLLSSSISLLIEMAQCRIKVKIVFVVFTVFYGPVQIFLDANLLSGVVGVFAVFGDLDGFDGRVYEMVTAVG